MGNYDSFAREYAKGTAVLESQTRELFRSLLPESISGMSVLDVGCGSGQDAEYYQKRGARFFGLDISQKEIEIAIQTKPGEFRIGDMNNLPYDSETFDLVTSFYAVQASEKPALAIGEMIRVAKPRGLITILTKHPFRNLLEGYRNDGKMDYYSPGKVTSYIFNRTIKLNEPGHTMRDYLHPDNLSRAELEVLEERTDFPASEQVIPGLIYPTFMVLRFRKKDLGQVK